MVLFTGITDTMRSIDQHFTADERRGYPNACYARNVSLPRLVRAYALRGTVLQ